MNNYYDEWLRRQEILCFEARDLALKRKIKSKPLISGNEPPIFRIILDGGFLDFCIREIKTSEVKNIWVAKVSDIDPKTHWLIHSSKEGDWLYIYSDYLMKKGERKINAYHKDVEYYVVDRMACKSFDRLLQSLKKIEEKEQQKVLTKWFD